MHLKYNSEACSRLHQGVSNIIAGGVRWQWRACSSGGAIMGRTRLWCRSGTMASHLPLPGIKVGDIGPKFGYNGVDNGFLSFNHVRVPLDNMLMRFAKARAPCDRLCSHPVLSLIDGALVRHLQYRQLCPWQQLPMLMQSTLYELSPTTGVFWVANEPAWRHPAHLIAPGFVFYELPAMPWSMQEGMQGA